MSGASPVHHFSPSPPPVYHEPSPLGLREAYLYLSSCWCVLRRRHRTTLEGHGVLGPLGHEILPRAPPFPSFQARVMLWRRRTDGLAYAFARYRLLTCPSRAHLRLAGKGVPPSRKCENIPSLRVKIAQHSARVGPCARQCSLVSGLAR